MSNATMDPSRPQRSDEQLLTGETKAAVEKAVLAAYPGATIERTETDSDGVYESHVVTTDGQHVIVQVDDSFAVTGTRTGGPGACGAAWAGTTGRRTATRTTAAPPPTPAAPDPGVPALPPSPSGAGIQAWRWRTKS